MQSHSLSEKKTYDQNLITRMTDGPCWWEGKNNVQRANEVREMK